MPRFDGTGPQGGGPMTGRGEGYCVLELPRPGKPASGYAGVDGVPVRLELPGGELGLDPSAPVFQDPVLGRRRGRATRRGRGRRFSRW
jgi:hypothetical protein